MTTLRFAIASLLNRRLTATLSLLSIAISVLLLLCVEKVRIETRTSFANTVSGTDLIVGARSGSVQLLLYSVFRIGNATNNISWQSLQDISQHTDVDWVAPLSLGDSHRGHRVVGTTIDYFEHYRYASKRSLQFAEGVVFDDVFDAVLGADVAGELGYRLGDQLVVAHGIGSAGLVEHDKQPFRVAGILEKTGTPVDKSIHVSLAGIEAMHMDWQSGAKIPGQHTDADTIRAMDLEPKAVTAALIGLKSRIATFRVQRFINEYREEPLLAILPGVALQEIWELVGLAEQALLIVSVFVVIAGLLGMIAVLLATLNERRREMAILRSAGARPLQIFGLLAAESGMLTLTGVLLGVVLFYMVIAIGRNWVATEYGIDLQFSALSLRNWVILGIVTAAGILAGVIPAIKAYRQSLADGMMIRT